MGWVLVIEENQSTVEEIKDAIAQFDQKAALVHFPNSQSFLDWMDKLQKHEPNLDPPVPADKFLGLITAIESWKFRDVKLIGKFKALFIQKGFAQTEDEIFTIFTAYETADFQKRRFEYRSVNNLIFKPFDKLVLQQLLEIAFGGRQPVKNHLTHSLKTESEVEMLKEIRLNGVSEIGFQTISNQLLEPGAIAKYYADFLETRHHRSALAKVLSCTAQPTAGLYDIELRFYALDQYQSFAIQKLAQAEKTHRPIAGRAAAAEAFEFYLVKKDGSPLASELAPSLERFFEHPVHLVDSLHDLNTALAAHNLAANPLIKRRFVFIDQAHIAGNEKGEIESLTKTHSTQALSCFSLSPRIYSEPLELELSQVCEDIFYAPFNKSYIIKTLKKRYPELATKEDIFEYHHLTDQVVHVSNPVKVVEVSETELIIEYHREIHLGSFREFHFRMPNELEVPTIIAQCNFTKPSEKKGIFHCHFIFFGMRDYELKFVRRWMLTQYVETKQKDG